MNRFLAAFALLLSGLWLTPLPAPAAEPNLAPVIEKLGSPATRDRIIALRDLARAKPSVSQSKPIFEKVLADPAPEVRDELVWAVSEALGAEGAEILEKLYQDGDRTVRNSAIRASCKMWNNVRLHELCKTAFSDPDYNSRNEVLTTLREDFPKDPRAGEIFRKALKDPSELVQRSAVFACQSARDPQCVPDLARLARTGSELVGVPAAEEALATIGNAEAVRELISLLPKPKGEPGRPARPSDEVRAAAARALHRIKDPKALPALRELLADPSVVVRVGAIGAITEMRDKEAVPKLLPLLNDKETRIRLYSLRGLRLIADPSCVNAVRQLMKTDKEIQVRASAVLALTDLLGPKAIPDLAAAKDDMAWEVRSEIAGALGGLGSAAAPTLAKFLDDPASGVREMAIRNLGQIGGPEHIPALDAASKDLAKSNFQVRLAVASALGGLRHQDGLSVLGRLAADPEPAVRQAAAKALGQIGGPKAQKLLEPMLKDAVGSVRNEARRANEAAANTKR